MKTTSSLSRKEEGQRYTCIQALESKLTSAVDALVADAKAYDGEGPYRALLVGLAEDHGFDSTYAPLLASMIREHGDFEADLFEDELVVFCPTQAVNHTKSQNTLRLQDLVNCGLEEVHLCSADEDHELATIAELNGNTLTEQGKQDWSDVLAAKVERLHEGAFGFHVALSEVAPERLRDFSFMLAGDVTITDTGRWIVGPEENPDEDETPSMDMQ